MTTSAIRKKLSAYMQVADDKKVKAVYALLESDIEAEFEYSEELKQQLEDGYAYYKTGGKMVTPAEMEKRVNKIIQKGKRK